MNPRIPRSILRTFAALFLPVACFGQTAATWDFVPGTDTFADNALLDLRFLNEDIAGQSGWVYQVGSDIYLGDGTPVRFWGINQDLTITTMDGLRDHARTLSKRGVNLARWHASFFNTGVNDINNAFSSSRIASIKRNVAVMKEEGIYSKLSMFFVLSFRINPNWGLEGYTAEYLAGNNRQPFGLIFFNETLQQAFKSWLWQALATPNNHEPNNTPVGQDTSVAFIELQNEDNVLFHTFNPALFPEAQRRMIETKFGAWAAARYGSIAAARTTWNNNRGRDNVAEGRLEAPSIGSIAGQLSNNLRNRDYLRFLAETQKAFWENIQAYLRDEIGYQGLIMASNWKTADDARLLDLEHWTYSAVDTIGANSYFNPIFEDRPPPNDKAFGPGQFFWTLPGPATPARIPATRKHVENRTSIITEFAWVAHAPYRAEAAFLTSAYAALGNLNAMTWFRAEKPTFEVQPAEKWPTMVPSIMGQFPATALMYRRGDVAPAPVVVREGRTLDHLVAGHRSAILQPSSFDATRDDPANFNPIQSNGSIDLLSFAIGRVELAFDTDENYVIDTLSDYVDSNNGIVTSITGEVITRINDDAVIIDTPRSQGVVGKLNYRSQHSLSDVIIRAGNDYGAILVTALDDLPIAQSTRILIQMSLPDAPTGFSTRTVSRMVNGQMVDVQEIMNLGASPQTVERLVNGRIRLKNNDRVTAVKALDAHGYFRGDVSGFQLSSGYQFDLPPDALYVIVELAPATDTPPVIASKAFPTAVQGSPYSTQAMALSGSGVLTWSTTSNLPDGLIFTPEGILQGTPTVTGIYAIDVEVEDEAGGSNAISVPLWIRPAIEGFEPPTPSDWQSEASLGFIFNYGATGWYYSQQIGFFYRPSPDSMWIFQSNIGWVHLLSGSLANGLHAYSSLHGWIYANSSFGQQFYLLENAGENPWREWSPAP